MDSESGIFSMTFDQSGSRLITTEADKTIKIYKEDDSAVSIKFLKFFVVSRPSSGDRVYILFKIYIQLFSLVKELKSVL